MVDNYNDPFSHPTGQNRENSLPGQSQWEPNQGGQTPNQGAQVTRQGGFLNQPLNAVRQQIENQIAQAVDHYAGHVPGGDKYSPEAKKAIAGVLDGLQNQLENEAANRLGGLGRTAFGADNQTNNSPFGGGGQTDNQGGLL